MALNAQIGNTPDGNVYIEAAHLSWLDDTTFLQHPFAKRLNIAEEDDIVTSGVLQLICDMSCEFIERKAGTYFVQQTVTQLFQGVNVQRNRLIKLVLKGKPITAINSLTMQYLNSMVSIAPDYLTTQMSTGSISFYPSLFLQGGVAAAVPENLLHQSEANLWVNYTFGMPKTSMNPPLITAAAAMASFYIGLSANPTGAAMTKNGDMEASYKFMKDQHNPLLEFVDNVIKSYKSRVFFATTND